MQRFLKFADQGTLRIYGFFFFFWLHCKPCGIFVPQQGIKPAPLILEPWSLNYWMARVVHKLCLNSNSGLCQSIDLREHIRQSF